MAHHRRPPLLESQAGTIVRTAGQTIVASATPGSAGNSNQIAITPGGAISVNGATVGGSNVNAIIYIDHTAFQGNTVGDYYGPITASSTGVTAVTSPLPSVLLSNATLAASSPTGTVVGTLSVTTGLPSGTIGTGAYAWTYSLSGTGSSNFQIVGSSLEALTNNMAGGSYGPFTVSAANASVLGSPFTLPVTVTVAPAAGLSNITLSNSSFTYGASGTVIGAITVVMSSGSFTGTLSLSGTNSSDFQLSSTTLPSNLETLGTFSSGSPFSINIVATQGGATGSPLTVPFTITGTSSGGFVFTPASTGANGVLTGGYVLVFDEEFNGSAVDTTKWSVLNGNTLNGVVVHSANATVTGGVLELMLTGSSSSAFGSFITTNGKPFSYNLNNGAVYAEARLRCPQQPAVGVWPAWWVNTGSSTPECDFQEFLGRAPNQVNATYFNANGTEASHEEFNTGVDQGLAYHIVGCVMSLSQITWYLDGSQIAHCTNGQTGQSSGGVTGQTVAISAGPYILNLQIGGGSGYGGAFNGSTAFPSTFKVDYVHVYQVGGTSVSSETNYGGPGSTAGPTS